MEIKRVNLCYTELSEKEIVIQFLQGVVFRLKNDPTFEGTNDVIIASLQMLEELK